MSIGDEMTCLFCLSPGATMQVKLDRKGKPFFTCHACGTRAFTPSKHALKGPEVLWGPLTLRLKVADQAVGRALIEKAAERVEHAA
jgi:RNase P subunit RPR2